jgi:hypothetical protein
MITIAVVGSNVACATSVSEYSGGGEGTISGIVVSPTGNVVDWSQIYANNGNQTFEAFSGFSGFYLMRVPAGTYNVSVYDFYNPQYWAPSMNVTVTDGSNITVNFYLQPQPPAPVPEFQPNLLAVVAILAIGAACVVTKHSRKRSFHPSSQESLRAVSFETNQVLCAIV